MPAASATEEDQAQAVSESVTIPMRLLGLLPLAFFAAHLSFYWRNGGLDNMLWMCTVGNLVLAIGLLFGLRWMIRVAVIWLVPGLPLWLYYVAVNGGWLLTSFFTHVGALIVGLFAVYKIRASRWTWVHAFVWFLLVQQLSRMVTTPYWNVNVAHRVYEGWEGVFSSYWQYWLASTGVVAAGLWVLGLFLLGLFPRSAGPRAASAGPD